MTTFESWMDTQDVFLLQRAACSGSAPKAGDFTTEAEQEKRLLFIAELTNANIRAKLLNDSAAAADFVEQALNSPLVLMADLAPGCYDV